jgi:HSP20 family protein
MIRQLTGLPSLFEDFGLMRRDWDRLFEPWGRPVSIRAATRGTFPMINVGTDANAVHVYAFLPGIDSAKLDVSLQDNVLTLSGERAGPDGARNLYLQERFSGPFKRTITMPDDIDPEQVDAKYRNGVLHITIARREESKPRRIEVN